MRLVLPILSFAALVSPAIAYAVEPIHICEDAGEWPPYTYYRRVEGKSTGNLTGFAVDMVAAILKNSQFRSDIELLPWARCQKEVAGGHKYQLALNASYSEERARTYYLSAPFYSTTNYYFFSRRTHPKGLAIASMDDLKKYRVCGLLGYNYETYGLAAGSVDQGTRDFPALIGKLHAGRCDLFLEKYEVMAGFTAIGQPLLADKDLGRAPVPGMQPTEFHMIVSRNYEHGEMLLRELNEGIARMRSSGQMEKLLKKYFSQ